MNKIRKPAANPKLAAQYAFEQIIDYSKSSGRNIGTAVTSRYTSGKSVFTEEWDLLILLDSCRYDTLKEVSDEYDWIHKVDRKWSVGAQSAEWMLNTFDNKWINEIRKTGYVTANPHSKTVFENRLKEDFRDSEGSKNIRRLKRWGDFDVVLPEELGLYDPVWSKADSRDGEGYGLYGSPRTVTNEAIRVGREQNLDRLIVHYMPPHVPYVINASKEGRDMYEYERNPWKYLNETGDREPIRDAHLAMIRWVLEEVELLLDNIDRENVIISADHGDAFDEYGVRGHPTGTLHPSVRYVPWAPTTATDRHTHTVDEKRTTEEEVSAEERLEALGYL